MISGEEIFPPVNEEVPNVNNDVAFYQNAVLATNEEASLRLNISPNPASDYITIKADTPIEHVNIYGIAGNVLFSEVNPSQTVNISALTAGIYFVEVIANNHRNIQKLIKK
ncbi:T9SS type A sorting domain-containing protein [Rasiella rasia]|uniref:T9SS type A sorting domain-containing protein n=1 Tax=Rasiella rasia TaxID=2744027 RepID=A0A6G6GMA7_9FLAO|nr:T9SS type A sorting domain-containing protein [Rasiella rasia]QIE59715.1 T9SS type A sorting domain-containing protein [Rasiella rasia]